MNPEWIYFVQAWILLHQPPFKLSICELESLDQPESFSIVTNIIIQSTLHFFRKSAQMGMFQCPPHILLLVNIKGIQIGPQSSRKEDRILLRIGELYRMVLMQDLEGEALWTRNLWDDC